MTIRNAHKLSLEKRSETTAEGLKCPLKFAYFTAELASLFPLLSTFSRVYNRKNGLSDGVVLAVDMMDNFPLRFKLPTYPQPLVKKPLRVLLLRWTLTALSCFGAHGGDFRAKFNDVAMMNNAVNSSSGGERVFEYLVPGGEDKI